MKSILSKCKRIGVLFLAAGKAWIGDEAPRMSAALAFYAMLSLSPLLLTATSIAGFFYEKEAAQQELIMQVRHLAGTEGAEVVEEALSYAEFSKEKSIKSVLLAAGLLVFASTAVFMHLQAALNKVWNVEKGDIKMNLGKRLLVLRGRSLALVLSVGFLLVISLVTSAVLALLKTEMSQIWTGLDEVLTWSYNIFSIGVLGTLFAFLFMLLPDATVNKRAAFIGGLSTAGLLTLGKMGIGLYLGNSAVGSVYGAAGSLVVFLLWIYYSMLVFFLGAEFTHELSEDLILKEDAV